MVIVQVVRSSSTKFLGHLLVNSNSTRVEQLLIDHLINTARYASVALENIGLKNVAYLAGLLHDLGKYKIEYQEYLEKAAIGEKVKRGSVNHTFAGVIYILEQYRNEKTDRFGRLTSEVIAYAIGAHHGLFDVVNLENESGFVHRLSKDRDEISYQECIDNFFIDVISKDDLDLLFLNAKTEIQEFISKMGAQKVLAFQFGMLVRLITSAVVHGDRRDTAEFMRNKKYNTEKNETTFWKEQLNFLEDKITRFKADTPINIARKYISDECRKSAEKVAGIYRCTVPTGGGKTLATLRYAYAHASRYDKSRIIYVIPLLSVLEQNSKVIKEYCQDKGRILEHHSNVVLEQHNAEELDYYELLTESWSEKIVITTFVRLLETLFNGKMTDVRRFQSLVNSVIVIDEIQSIPKKMIHMFNVAMNFLAQCCNATVILCSATQPVLECAEYPLLLKEDSEMVPYKKEVWNAFERTNVKNLGNQFGWTTDEIVDFIIECLKTSNSVLMICNTKDTAAKIYKRINECITEEVQSYHLSTSMCMEHRVNTMKEISNLLVNQTEEKVICISTQLIEAGVDLSFECVIRAQAGLDNVAQAAGRCNRHGEYVGRKETFVIKVKDENISRLKDIMNSQEAYIKFLQSKENGVLKDEDILSFNCIKHYYSLLYLDVKVKKEFSYPHVFKECLNKTHNLFDLLSNNNSVVERRNENLARHILQQSFKTAGDVFQVFEDNTVDVIVPYNDIAKEIINEVRNVNLSFDLNKLQEIITRVKPYTVQIYDYQRNSLETNGLLEFDTSKHFLLLKEEGYDDKLGVKDNYNVEFFILD